MFLLEEEQQGLEMSFTTIMLVHGTTSCPKDLGSSLIHNSWGFSILVDCMTSKKPKKHAFILLS